VTGTRRALRVLVTAPRRILPGTSYLLTRRCSERRSFLRPSKLTNDIFQYVLGAALARYGVLLHAACVMSNHYHLVVTDPDARLPAFMQYLDSLVARAVNSTIGHFESFWAGASTYSAVVPIDRSDVLAKCAYVLANPVAAGLVRRGVEWPGLRSTPGQVGAPPLVVHKPERFFRADGYMPASVELVLTPPPGFSSAQEFRTRLAAETEALEERHRREIAHEGRGFLGVARVLRQNPASRPVSREVRFALNPRVAARDAQRRIDELAELKEFQSRYRAAWCARAAGIRDVVFPAGTYLLRVLHGVQCAVTA
jgi:REP element-mobilizing transposase RayT